jgi:hypothetical protein
VEVVVIDEVEDVEMDDVVDTVPRAYIPATAAKNKTIKTITTNSAREIAAPPFDPKIFLKLIITVNPFYLSLYLRIENYSMVGLSNLF